jgi:predicted outer membrane protein
MAHANPIQIQKFLKGVDYPANKAELIENAKKLGADENIQASLEQLPDKEFQTPADVSEEFKGPSGDQVERPQDGPDGKAGAGAGKRGKAAPSGAGSNEFLVQVAQDSVAEIELCLLALRKSANPEIRKFALTMIDEHSTLGQELEQLAQKKKLDLKLQPDDQHRAASDKLAKVPLSEFDRRLMEQNLKDHEQGLKLFQQYAAEEKDPDIKALAEHGEKLYTRHLKMVHQLEQKMRA